MAALEEVARGEGCAKMTLEVQENNRQARSLYEAIGYKGSFLSEEAGDQRFLTKFL
jgi:ribosomal protein S18 acetylase RimI-like enzyme